MWKNLWASRKFRIMIFDAVLSTLVLSVTTFLAPDYAEVVMEYVKILQIPVFAVVVGIAVEDAGAKRSGTMGDRTPEK